MDTTLNGSDFVIIAMITFITAILGCWGGRKLP